MTFLIILLALLGLIVLVLLLVLITPLVLYINTNDNTYYVKLKGVTKVQLMFGENAFWIHIRIFFVPFRIDPLKPRKKKKKEADEKPGPVKKKRKIRSLTALKKMTREMFRSFRIELRVRIDTGDVIGNAWLVPAFTLINRETIHLTVNNAGKNDLELRLQNRLLVMLIIFIRYRIRRSYSP